MSREVTVVLRPASELPSNPKKTLTPESHAERHGARPEDIEAVKEFAQRNGLEFLWAHGEARTVRLRVDYDVDPTEFPEGVVTVLGLDDKPVARPRLRPAKGAAAALTAPKVAKAYNFPAGDGAGQAIAIVELGGGFGQADLDAYFSSLHLPTPQVSSITVSGGQNKSDGPNGADGEVLLDIEVAGAVAPGARYGVYFGPNTDAGFLSAINAAIHDPDLKPSAISISWGAPETEWSKSTMDAFDQAFASAKALGIAVLTAAGDTGSTDSTTADVADFPAASPNVVACGGTDLILNTDGSIASESVWNVDPTSSATGGGFSSHFAKPAYQDVVLGTRRGEPDVSGNADPNTGYLVVVDGGRYVIGGTSAVAPLFAGLVVLLNAATGRRVGGSFNETSYRNPQAFRDVTVGNNGTYRAGPGWDAASGLGSPDGARLLQALSPPTPAPPTSPTSPPAPDPGPAPAPQPSGGGEGCFRFLLGLTDGERAAVRHRAALHHETPDAWIESRVKAALHN